MRKIRWGVISTASIGLDEVIPAMQKGESCEVIAIASRELAKARLAAQKLGIPKAYGSYDALLSDAEVEAVYIPLPNHLHVPWSVRALEAGKHVLCEKPISMDAAQAQELLEASRKWPHLKIMEAFMYRFHPQWQLAHKYVMEGKIGELRTINSFFSYYETNPANVRNIADMGGGGLMDVGCYSISLSRFLFGSEPERVIGSLEYDPIFKTDRLASGILEFSRGTATFTCSTQLASYQKVNILGTQGRLELDIPFNAPHDGITKVFFEHDSSLEEIVIEACDQYTIQGDAFSQAILKNIPAPTPLEDAVANMKVIDALVRSAKTAAWV